MNVDPAAQAALLKLADLDSDLARVKHQAQTLPQHKEIQTLMAERQGLADRFTAASTEADDLEVAARKAEQDLVPVRARLERDQQRVNDGSVTDAKAVQGLVDEIAHLERRIGTLEDEQLEIMGQAEDAREVRDGLAQRKSDVEVRLRQLVAERDAAVAELKAEARAIASARGPVERSVPEAALELYDKLRTSSGLGAASLQHGRCGGCQLELNVSDLHELRSAPADQLLRCPECGRILVRKEG